MSLNSYYNLTGPLPLPNGHSSIRSLVTSPILVHDDKVPEGFTGTCSALRISLSIVVEFLLFKVAFIT